MAPKSNVWITLVSPVNSGLRRLLQQTFFYNVFSNKSDWPMLSPANLAEHACMQEFTPGFVNRDCHQISSWAGWYFVG